MIPSNTGSVGNQTAKCMPPPPKFKPKLAVYGQLAACLTYFVAFKDWTEHQEQTGTKLEN